MNVWAAAPRSVSADDDVWRRTRLRIPATKINKRLAPQPLAADTRASSAPKYCFGSRSTRAGRTRTARSYSGADRLRIAACETRTSGPPVWHTSSFSSPSSARTFRMRAGSRAAFPSAAAACRSSTPRRGSTAPPCSGPGRAHDQDLVEVALRRRDPRRRLPLRLSRRRVDQPDNRALRAAHELRVPLVYFVGTRPGWYKPVFPVFVTRGRSGRANGDASRRARMRGPDRRAASPCRSTTRSSAATPSARRASASTRRASAAASFPAYANQCAICRLKELRLLDAAHIVADVEARGEPTVTNGLSLCAIHHRAFDQNLVGVSPDYDGARPPPPPRGRGRPDARAPQGLS